MKRFKRIISFILALCLIFSSFAFADGEQPETELTSIGTDESGNEILNDRYYIRIGLYYGSDNYASDVNIVSDYGFDVYDASSYMFIEHLDSTSLNFNYNDTSCSNKIYMSAAPDPDSRLVKLLTNRDSKYTTYRDGILLICNNGIRVINYLTIEHYVWGIVNKEMSSKNPSEALKAQAVASRTYALYLKENTGSHSSMGFNLCKTTHCQVYGGYSSENSITTQACKDTEGLIMTYGGKPIYAVFSANSGGGYTTSIYDGWGIELSKHPYLQSVADPYTPVHKWETTYTFSEIRDRLISKLGTDLGNIVRVEVSDTTSKGYITGLLITGTNGSKRVPRSQIMSVFNLKSTFFCIGDDGYNEIVESTATPDSYFVLNNTGVNLVPSSTLYVYDGQNIMQMKINENNSYAMTNDICTGGYVYMRGLGFGHGIGMSQNGAINMAKNYGKNFAEILNFYYTGITIENY